MVLVGFSQQIPWLVSNQTHCFRLKNPCSTFVRNGNAGRIVARLGSSQTSNCLAVLSGWSLWLEGWVADWMGWMGLKSVPLSATSKPQIIPLSNPQKLGLFFWNLSQSCICLSFWWQICYDFLGSNLHYARCGKIKDVHPNFWYLNKSHHDLWPWNPHVSNEKKGP